MVNNPFIPDPDPQAVPEFLSRSPSAGRRLRIRVIMFTTGFTLPRAPPPGIPRADRRDGGADPRRS
eukprot:11705686-Alexandrium_andersonii.AAC.1